MRRASYRSLAWFLVALSAACGTRPDRNPTGEAGGPGRWGPVLELPTHPEQMVVLPSGKVLMWPWAPDRKSPPHGPPALWNPSDGSSTIYRESGVESASGLAFQPDGVLLSAGGDLPSGGVNGNPRSFNFDSTTESWSEVASMASGRVAPGATTLGNGEILVTGGWDKEGEVNRIPELWNGSTWTPLPHAGNDESGLWTLQFLAPDGRLFRAGPERLTDWLDVTTGTWSDVEAGHRNQTRYHGTAVMYDEGKILLAGGCPVGPEEDWYEQCRDTVLASAEVIDLLDPDPAWREVSPMASARHSHHATLLPDGRVLITGGTDRPGLFNDETAGILSAEIWDPQTETFTTVAAMDEPHHFQSTAVLLPDARVLVAGGLFGTSEAEPDFSWSGQIYSPSYLEAGPRPEVSGAPSSVRYGAEFTVDTPDASAVSEVVLLGLSASRNGWNGNQRLARLSFTTEADRVRARALSNPNVVPPGFYLLFLMSEQGVPSYGSAVRIGRE